MITVSEWELVQLLQLLRDLEVLEEGEPPRLELKTPHDPDEALAL